MNTPCETTTDIKMPFVPLMLSEPQIIILGAALTVGKTLYVLHLLEENSLKGSDKKGLVYFVSTPNRVVVKNSGFGKMLETSENIGLHLVNRGIGEQLIFDMKRKISAFKPEYIVIDGFEKIFDRNMEGVALLNKVNKLFSDLKLLSTEINVPVIVTTTILLTDEIHSNHTRPLLCRFGSNVVEITAAKHVLNLDSPFHYGSEENINKEDIWRTMVLYKLNPSSTVIIPTRFEIDKEAERFYPIIKSA